jgi:ketosteroid isomerase-like protein
MSKENLELVEVLWDAFQRGDVGALRGAAHPDIVIVQPSELPDSKTYLGHEGVKEAVEDWPTQWDEFRFEVLETIEVSDSRIVSVTRHHGRGAASGIEVEATIGYVLEIADGKFARVEMFASREQALEAAARSE